jgi:multidrug efflux pump subunit AcrB
MQQLIRNMPGIENVVSRIGRGESPADPAGPNEADVIATLAPIEERPRALTQEKIANQMRDALSSVPGINLVMSQPISDRVDEMVTGVRADVRRQDLWRRPGYPRQKSAIDRKSSLFHSWNAGYARGPHRRPAVSGHRY